MRYFMVDPDNEERLLKIPPRVVAEIQAAARDAERDRWLEDEADRLRKGE